MAAADPLKRLISATLRDELGELREQTRGLETASAESAAYLELEVNRVAERVSRLEQGVAGLREALDRRGARRS
jgi:DNA anti-recombination protein RmuC